MSPWLCIQIKYLFGVLQGFTPDQLDRLLPAAAVAAAQVPHSLYTICVMRAL